MFDTIPSFVKTKQKVRYEKITPEDVPLIVELYKTMPIDTIANKFDTTRYRIVKAIKGANVSIKDRKAAGIRKEILAADGNVNAEELAKKHGVEQYYIYKLRKLLGYPPTRLPRLADSDFSIVIEVNNLRESGVSLVEACAIVGCTESTYQSRKRNKTYQQAVVEA